MGLLSKAASMQCFNTQSPVKPDARMFIENYLRTNGPFHCIVIKSGVEELSGMVSHLGSVHALENGNCIVLVPLSMDRGLLAHRISKSLSSGILCQFAAESADEAVKNLASFL